jgi:hypothetical protein
MKLYGNISYIGEYLDAGTAGYAALIGCPNGALFELACYAANQTYLVGAGISATVPFTWTTNDRVSFRANYEAA